MDGEGRIDLALAAPVSRPHDDGRLGLALKRLQVALPLASRPAIIDAKGEVHNLVEVFNQLATIERLIDCLEWASLELSRHRVAVCHPTTSSQVNENDLVLTEETSVARFEVCDVVGRTDGNQKERATLRALGVEGWLVGSSEAARLFIVASPTFGDLLLRRKGRSHIGGDWVGASFDYVRAGTIRDTTIVELRRSNPMATTARITSSPPARGVE